MVAPDLEAFRSHLLQMTDLLAVETAALIEARPRFAHSVLVLAERSAVPGERLKANYVKQLDPLWIETKKVRTVSEPAQTASVAPSKKEDLPAPCLLCRQRGHTETSHFEDNRSEFETSRYDKSTGMDSSVYSFPSPKLAKRTRDENNNHGAVSPPPAHKLYQQQSPQRTLSPLRRPLATPSKLRLKVANHSSIEEVLTPPASKLHSPAPSRGAEKPSERFDFSPRPPQDPTVTAPRKPWFASREYSTPQPDQASKNGSAKLPAANNAPSCSNQNVNKAEVCRPAPLPNNQQYTERYEMHEKWSNDDGTGLVRTSFPATDGRRLETTSKFSTSETHEEFVKRVYRKKCLDYGVFPSEKREQYARWRANSGISDPPPVDSFESRANKMKVSVPPHYRRQDNEKEANSRTDPLISEAIRILEASCHMLDETTRRLNKSGAVNSANATNANTLNEVFSRNKFQTASLCFPSQNRSRSQGAGTQHRRFRSGHDYDPDPLTLGRYDGDMATTTTVTTKLIHEKITETVQQN